MTRSCNFIGTWNNYPADWKRIIESNCLVYVAQLEKGKNAEKEHIQFAIKFKEARHFKAVCKLFPGAHIEPAKNWAACKNYCKKDDTAQGERIDNTNKPPCKDPLADKKLREIQEDILDIVNSEPDDRTVHWFYDPVGGAGKTTLAKHLCLHNKDCLYLTGKASDMKYGIFQWLQKNKLKTVLIDLTRSVESFVSYQGIEEVKNGIFYNTKYESTMCLFDNPHVIILANFLPDKSALTEDRWHIHNYDQNRDNKIIKEFLEANNIL